MASPIKPSSANKMPSKSTKSKKNTTPRTTTKSPSNTSPKRKTPPTAKRTAHKGGDSRSTRLKCVAIAMGIIVVAFVLFFDISTVQSNAMNPTLWRGDVVLSWNPKLFSVQLAPGDIALFRPEAAQNDKTPHSTDLEPNFLRCISSYGEEISYNQDVFQINGVSLARTELTNRAIVRPVDVPKRGALRHYLAATTVDGQCIRTRRRRKWNVFPSRR